MDFLTIPGNISSVPYQKNECSLYSDSGECFIYKGWAIITDAGEDYEATVYDGIIDLYKNIENLTLAQLGIDEIAHQKEPEVIRQTWVNNYNYRYILADYNGKTGNTAAGEVNIDYLVPSVKVKYLWDKIFNKANAEYSGSVFNTEAFKNLWLTYTKGINTAASEQVVFNSTNYDFVSAVVIGSLEYSFFQPQRNRYYAKYLSFNEFGLASALNGVHLKVAESGYYRLEVTGNINTREYKRSTLFGNQVVNDHPASATIALGKNCEQYGPLQAPEHEVLISNYLWLRAININKIIYLEAFDSLCLTVGPNHNGNLSTFYIKDLGTSLTVKISKITTNTLNFNEALGEFTAKDFLNEIVHRFGLTMYKEKYADKYHFLTLQEQLQEAATADWSNRLVKKVSENYAYGSYARRNWMRYNYNDKESDYLDGYFDIGNINLPDSRDVIKSKIYGPERARVQYLGRESNVYRLWDKEITEQPAQGEEAVQYTPLDKRFYFLRCVHDPGTITLVSEELQASMPVTGYYRESFFRLNFMDIVNDYYNPLYQLLNRSVVITADLYLSEADIVGFDFMKLYYFRQFSGYFIMNKINGYVPGKPVKCELVRVLYNPLPGTGPSIDITGIAAQGLTISVSFTTSYIITGNITLEFSFDGNEWSTQTSGSASPQDITLPSPGTYYIRLFHSGTGTYSTITEFTV